MLSMLKRTKNELTTRKEPDDEEEDDKDEKMSACSITSDNRCRDINRPPHLGPPWTILTVVSGTHFS